jgi:PAS domain S-box-containing protein
MDRVRIVPRATAWLLCLLAVLVLVGWITEIDALTVVGLSIMVVSTIVATAIWWNAHLLARSDGERRRAEDALRESEERYRELIESANDIVFSITPDGTIVSLNVAFERATGWAPSEWIGQGFEPLVHAEDLSLARERIAEMMAGGRPPTYRVRIRTAAGGFVVLEASTHPHIVEGEVVELRGICRDITERQVADEARRRADETFRAFVEFGPDAVVVADAAGCIVSVNEKTEAMFGYGRDELLGHPLELLLPEPYRSAHQAHRSNYAGDPHARPMGAGGTLHGRRKDGTELVVEISLSPLPTQEGTLFAAAIRDVTARNAAGEALRESEARLQAILDHSPAFVYMKDLQGRYVFINRTYETLFDVDRAEFLGKTDHDLVDHVIADERRARDRLVIESGEPLTGEYAATLSDGSEHTWVSVKFPLKDARGDVYAICGVYTDITDRKVAEEALQASEARFRVLSDSAFEGILIRDGDRILDTNRAFASMFGYEREDVVGMDWRSFVVPDNSRTVADYVADGSKGSIEVTGVRKDGTSLIIRGRGMEMPFRGRMARVVALQDISDLKEAEHELLRALELEQQATERLHELDRMKDAFLRAVSHDLRTPLAVIVWLAEALSQSEPGIRAEEAGEYLSRIVAHAKDLDRLVLDLLDFDRLSREDGQLVLTSIDVGALVAGAVERSEFLADHVVHVDAAPVVCAVDTVIVERMIQNLLVNAAKHTPDLTEVWVGVREGSGGVLISVDDAGPGVPEELRQAIFEPFRQGADGRRNASGVGIGLSLVARFAEMHDGSAWVEERPGGGSSFRVLLPMRVAEVATR